MNKMILLFQLSCMLLVLCKVQSFMAPTFGRRHAQRHYQTKSTQRYLSSDLFEDMSVTLRTSDFHDATIDSTSDKNGIPFTVGGIVRICKDGLKAYQTNPKGFGSYDENKNFIPDKGKETDKKKCLVLPVGLRGTISKLYDEDVISANLPIQVKFVPGQNVDEGYDPPTTFLMHFTPDEIECVQQ